MIKKMLAMTLSAAVGLGTLTSCTQQGSIDMPFVEDELKQGYTAIAEGTALTLYVDGSVSESGDGTESAPFKTIAEAQTAVRALKSGEGLPLGGVTVLVKDGEYYLTEMLVFNSEDSGTAESPVTYAAESEFGAVLTGGLILSADDFEPLNEEEKSRLVDDTAKDKVVKVNLEKYGFTADEIKKIDSQAFEFFVDGKRATIARYPNTGDVYTFDVYDIGDTHEMYSDEKFDGRGEATLVPNFDYSVNNRGGTFTVEEPVVNRISQWSSFEDVYVNGYFKWSWSNATVKIGSVNTEGDYAITLANAVKYGLSRYAPFYFFNVYDEIDMVNEFYMDTDSGYLYVYKGENFDSSEIMISRLNSTAVTLSGMEHFTFKGFGICAVKGGGVSASGNNLIVENCKVYNVYSHGISVSGSDIKVQNCEVANVGSSGISASGGDTATLTKGNIHIYNNYIHDYAEIQRTYQPAISIGGCGNTVSHNDIFNGPHQGIGYSGPLQIIEYNEIGNVCYETADAGAIYSGRNMTYYGSVIRYNYIHDVGNGKEVAAGIYWDDGLSGQTAYGNIVSRVYGIGITCSGRDEVIENNLIIDCYDSGFYVRILPRMQVLEELAGNKYWFEHAYDLSDQIVAIRETMDKEAWAAAFPDYENIIPYYRDYEGDLDDPNLSINPGNSSIKNNITFYFFNGDRNNCDINEDGAYKEHYWGIYLDMFLDLSLNPVIKNDITSIPGVNNDDFRILENSVIFELCPDFVQIPSEQIGRID